MFVKLAKEHNLSQADSNILWEVCQITNCNNILFFIKSNEEVNELFHTAYDIMKQENKFTDKSMNPISKSGAKAMFESGDEIWLLNSDNTKVLATSVEDIMNHDGMFGITDKEIGKIADEVGLDLDI